MKKKELARKITSWLTLGAFSVQPMLAFAEEILPDNNAPVAERPLVTETASGNPLVQITTPTAGGVSVNRYEFFNVPERGAILNNSYGLASTELAGYVQGIQISPQARHASSSTKSRAPIRLNCAAF